MAPNLMISKLHCTTDCESTNTYYAQALVLNCSMLWILPVLPNCYIFCVNNHFSMNTSLACPLVY